MKKYYVNGESTASNPDGSSWAKAFQNLQAAVDAAAAAGGGEVWVARGTYRATTDQIVSMKEGVFLYGGFAGTESELEERDWKGNVTTIDGEGQHRCVIGANDAILDGFTLSNGQADYGAGMYNYKSSPVIANCIFSENRAERGGGAMYNKYSSPVIANCTFNRSAAYYDGAGMRNYKSSPVVANCIFSKNTAERGGGGMHNLYYSSPVIANCIFSENRADKGGGMYNDEASPVIANCTFTSNSAGLNGGGMWNVISSPVIANCTFNGNTTESSSGGGMYNPEK